MSPDDIKQLNVDELKVFIAEQALKVSSLKQNKRVTIKAMNALIKDVEVNMAVAMDVLEGKDSALARRILVEIAQQKLPCQ